jgi:hypothetical protein
MKMEQKEIEENQGKATGAAILRPWGEFDRPAILFAC